MSKYPYRRVAIQLLAVVVIPVILGIVLALFFGKTTP